MRGHPRHKAGEKTYRRAWLSTRGCGRGSRISHAEAIGGFAIHVCQWAGETKVEVQCAKAEIRELRAAAGARNAAACSHA
jgi:hypothetical protein